MGNGLLTKRPRQDKPPPEVVDKIDLQNRAGPSSRQLARIKKKQLYHNEKNQTRLLSPEVPQTTNSNDLVIETVFIAENKKAAKSKSVAETKTESACTPAQKHSHQCSTDHARMPFTDFHIDDNHTARPTTPPAKRDRPHRIISPAKAECKHRSSKTFAAEESKPKDKYEISKWVVRRPQRSISDPRRERGGSLFRSQCSHVGCGAACRYAVSHTGIADLRMRLRRNLQLIDI